MPAPGTVQTKAYSLLKNYPVWLGHVFFIAYSIFCIKYNQQRSTLTDNAVYLFNLADSGSFFTPHDRYTSVVIQAFPLLFVYLGASLKTLMAAYSVSYALFYYAVFICCVHWLKNGAAGWALILVLCASIIDYFFWPQSEIQQGIAWLVLYCAMLPRLLHINKYFSSGVNFIFGSILVICHPLLLFPFFFVVAYEFAENRQWKVAALLPFIFCFVPFIIKPLIIPFDGYEQGRMLTYEKAMTGIGNFFSLKSTLDWNETITRESFRTVLLLLASFVILLKIKKFVNALLLVGFFICFLVLMNITNQEGEAPFYTATYLMILTFAVAYPFAKEIFYGRLPSFSWVFVAAMAFFFFRGIKDKNWYYGSRMESEKALVNYLNKYPEQKFIMNENSFMWEKLNFAWATAYETILISAIEGPEKTKLVYVNFPKDDSFISGINPEEVAFNPWDRRAGNKLNNKYFLFREGPYRQLTGEEMDQLKNDINAGR